MQRPEAPEDGPDPGRLSHVFFVYEIRREGDTLRYYGTPLSSGRELIRESWGVFREYGYEVRLEEDHGEWILVAEPINLGLDGIPWTHLMLFFATVASTLFAGSRWYHLDPFSAEIIGAWPFAAAILVVLGVHELGHYVMSRYHGVNASLPYFIPVPTLIGTMGAVIKMKGQIPSRKALFDIGVAGPLAGLGATIIITAIGLHLPPVTVPTEVTEANGIYISLGFPILMELIAVVVDQPLGYEATDQAINPVVIGGWVGMFITFLNMIPVGQLDGGHIVRAIAGDRQPLVGAIVPVILFGLAGYLYYFTGASLQGVMVWGVWGLLAAVFVAVGPAVPIEDEPLGRGRVLVGIATIVLALLCFHPVPIDIRM